MNNDLKIYLENTKKPGWLIFYRVLWEQMPQISSSKILDFGSGLGITANHFAKNNEVFAVEPDADMVENRIQENSYNQIIGNVEQLRQFGNDSFDLVICHNVIEYASERKDIFREFYRILKPKGIISIVKHNHIGRIISKIALENNLDQALSLFNGGTSTAAYFGKINYYEKKDIVDWIDNADISIEKVLGIRTFYALHSNNEVRNDALWQEKMFQLEMKASDIDEYKNIAFFNHLLLRKNS